MKTEDSVADGKLNDEQLGALTRRLDEIKRRLNEKTLSYEEVMKMTQIIIENKLTPDILKVIRGTHQITQIGNVVDGTRGINLDGSDWKNAWHNPVGVINWFTVQIRLEIVFLDTVETIESVYCKWKGFKYLDINVYDFLVKNPELIPENWKRRGVIIPFLGTILFPRKKKHGAQCPMLTFDENLEPVFSMWKIPSNFNGPISLPHITHYKKAPSGEKDNLLTRIFESEEIIIEATSGRRTIGQQRSSLFTEIGDFSDYDLSDYEINKKARATEKTVVEMYEPKKFVEIGTLLSSFDTALENLSLTQDQIIEFALRYENLISPNTSTLFLLKIDEEYLVDHYYYFIALTKIGSRFRADQFPLTAGGYFSVESNPPHLVIQKKSS